MIEKLLNSRFDSQIGIASLCVLGKNTLCIYQSHFKLLWNWGPTSLPVLVAHADERLANKTKKSAYSMDVVKHSWANTYNSGKSIKLRLIPI